jgi:hypothetical protein
MSNPPPPGGVPDDQYRVPADAALGGADAVPDTHYVPHAEPERPKGEGRVPSPPAARAPSATWAIIVFLVVGAVLVYLLGLGR